MDLFGGAVGIDLILQGGIIVSVLGCYLKIERRLTKLEITQEIMLKELMVANHGD